MKFKGLDVRNVYSNISSDFFSDIKYCESEYIGNVLSHLTDILGDDFQAYDFVIYAKPDGKQVRDYPFGANGRKEVVFFLSDERSTVPDALMRAGVFAVFKNYMPTSLPYDNLFHLPLGFVNTTAAQPVTPIGERPTNVFFSGALHAARLPLYQHFTPFGFLPFRLWNFISHRFYRRTNFDNYYPGSFIRFNKQGFRSGLNAQTYTQLLYNSKIVICPRGVLSFETYRHFEAMRAGCVIISEPLPDTFFYSESPIIFIRDWSEIDGIIRRLLSDPAELGQIQQDMLAWWEQVCSEKAVAGYVAGKIKFLTDK